MVKTLSDLLKSIREQIIAQSGDINTEILAPVVEDNRQIQSGGVFVARQGRSSDGHRYISQAIKDGAAAIIGEKSSADAGDFAVPYIQVKDARHVTGQVAAAYYDYPSRDLTITGITGTNGKTTTTHLLHSILKNATNNRAGFISTIGADFGTQSEDTGLHVTTPGAPAIQRYLAQMRDAGLTHAILEMTSHGLEQGRVSGVDIDIAVLTNITHEHLDEHGSWEAYRDAKAIMFYMLTASDHSAGISILNRDDPSYEYFAAIPAKNYQTYGLDSGANNYPEKIDYLPDVTRLTVDNVIYETFLVGEFNVYNVLAAITVARALNFAPDVIQAGLRQVEGVSGRLQRIDEGQDFTAIVDFAHTPDALRRVLQAGRQMLPDGKKLIVVFGSAGLRDVDKRRMMAEIGAELADMTILTAEDPRTEALDDILQMMADGCTAKGGVEGETFIRVPDRGEALFRACQLANTGDIVMACGKGHEQSMCFGTIEYPWDDRDALQAALRGTPLQTLPTARQN